MTGPLRSPLGVMLQPDSRDRKLVESKRHPGRVLTCAATYRPIRPTCPLTCAMHPDRADNVGQKCYVVRGNASHSNRRLEELAQANESTALEITKEEARLVTAYAKMVYRPTNLDLRLGVSGEASGPRGVASLAVAALDWKRLVGGDVWGYTHRWATILRDTWGPISVLASVDRVADLKRAMNRGYAPAIVVQEHPDHKPFSVPVGGHSVRFIRCPNETMGMACVECRLCLDGARLAERGMGIAFANRKRKLPIVGRS